MTPEQSAAIARISDVLDRYFEERKSHVDPGAPLPHALTSIPAAWSTILSALEEAQAVRVDWQPIETARAGQPVMLWKESTREHYVAAKIEGGFGYGWCTPDGFEIFGATHWQPLPAPPALTPGDKP